MIGSSLEKTIVVDQNVLNQILWLSLSLSLLFQILALVVNIPNPGLSSYDIFVL